MLGGLGAGGGEQPDHLRHRVKDGATGLHSGEPVLYCALCRQPPNLAQGRDLLTSVPEDVAAEIKYLESHGYPHRLRGNWGEEPDSLQKWAGARKGKSGECNSRHQHFWSLQRVSG